MRRVLLLFVVFWYLLWSIAPFIPKSSRPEINVYTLVELDMSLCGFLAHEVMAHIINPCFDILAAIPYTIHVFWPILFSLWSLKFRRHLTLPFLNCFGVISFIAVITQLLFPTAPPWYYEKYAMSPASYDLPGDPGGLVRVDEMFHFEFYHEMFEKSPLVFGAFPSLHVAWPSLLSLFLWFHVFTSWKLKLLPAAYLCWVCLAVIYLQHHYVADVLGGMMYSWSVYQIFGPHRDHLFPSIRRK